jgi:beta-galactosidase
MVDARPGGYGFRISGFIGEQTRQVQARALAPRMVAAAGMVISRGVIACLCLTVHACTDSDGGVTAPVSMAPSDNPPAVAPANTAALRERISIDEDWRFFKYAATDQVDGLVYDLRPAVDAAAAPPNPGAATPQVLKPWILPTGNDFIADPARRHVRPEGDPGSDFPFVRAEFDDAAWAPVNLPHDWAIAGPFQPGASPGVGGGMGRLPSPGVAWYRKTLELSAEDAGRAVFLDVDGAMSYAMVWLNGHLVGGWPFGYASWRVDLTAHLITGANQLAIRLDNPPDSSRWYPGGGLYRSVWLTKTNHVHVAQWGTYITTSDVSSAAATVNVDVTIDNDSTTEALVEAVTQIYALDADGKRIGDALAALAPLRASVAAGQSVQVAGAATLENPRLWGPPPTQTPQRYVAVTTLRRDGQPVDEYETRFGVRDVVFDPERGVLINGERIYLQGANQHHDLGALGAAFNVRAAERQLEMLREAGCNAIRMSHNPPAPELLELTDRMGFLVMDEAFDVWVAAKPPYDFHLIFPDWSEQDMRALVRRDRNHPSVIVWSLGNEVGEQFSGEAGAAVARPLQDITRDEDPTRPTTTAMNFAKPDMPLPTVPDLISLNYQGEGIRDAPAYAELTGIRTPPLYPDFHAAFPDKVILSSENAAAVSTRGSYLFPVTAEVSAPVADGQGGDPATAYVSSYELYTAPFGASADKVFASLDNHPYVGGGFVWSGWDYLGEPTPYYQARSSYFGIIDLAGFKKDRFYLYQAHWRPDFPMVHILPHWNWPERVGQVTPVHVFTSGDEVELFLDGQSLGRKAKAPNEYRLRYDDVIYAPGELRAVAYQNGQQWAEEVVRTTGEPAALAASVDREVIRADGKDLAFVTIRVTDAAGLTAPLASDSITFQIEGPGEIVATDNGNPMDFTAFPSRERRAFNGLALAIVRGIRGLPGSLQVRAVSGSLQAGSVTVESEP